MRLLALILLMIGSSTYGATDLATRLEVARINYDLPVLEKPTESNVFAFRIFVQPAFAYAGYAVSGRLVVPEVGEASGSLTVSQEGKDRTFALTHAQSRETLRWFHDAEFLSSETKETVDVASLDGDEMLIEAYVGGRHFRLHRNSGDSAASAAFFRSVEVFRIWKEELNQSAQPTLGKAPHG